ncbi:ice-binding family protein [Paludisphaera mucosa]|uniref:Ice-binding family protein n=1 Tax=Paludisphaera mucosa TaxID=3030827 RepID=A0ABT6FKX4_9BACT|nr:ice-binding family protein [Paludisphaera mucosa]MDG3008226.1 ice-binding family protein [Paludisphaera mucosa]
MKSTTMSLPTLAAVDVSTRAQADIVLGTEGGLRRPGGRDGDRHRALRHRRRRLGRQPWGGCHRFPPGSLVAPYTKPVGDAVAAQDQLDRTTAYNAAAALAPTQDLSSMNLGGLVLLPGVYFLSSSAQLTGTHTLDAQGEANVQLVFQKGSTLSTASGSSVSVVDAGSVPPGSNVFWKVGSSATLGTGTDFAGHILALTSITLNTDASIINGSALARNGAVTLDSDMIVDCVDLAAVPEAASLAMLGVGALGVLSVVPRRRRASPTDDPTKTKTKTKRPRSSRDRRARPSSCAGRRSA